MRRTAVELLALVLLAAGGGVGWGQQPAQEEKPRTLGPWQAPPAKSKLEEMLAQALKNNPDIRVAAAKVGEAEEKLNRTRLQVTQKVIALYHARESQQAAITFQQEKYERIRQLYGRGQADQGTLAETRQALTLAKSRLAEIESEITLLLGKQPPPDGTASVAVTDRSGLRDDLARYYQALSALSLSVRGPMADKIRHALDQSVSFEFTDKPVSEVLDKLRAFHPEIHLRMPLRIPSGRKVTVKMKDISFGAALEWFADVLGYFDLVVREYGILIVPKDQVPPGAVLLHDFWKGSGAEKEGPVTSRTKNPPPGNVEGLVSKIDPTSGLVGLTIGSDAGLAKGHTLEVFRLKPESKYLGTIRILAVTPHQAVAQPVGRMWAKIEVGDKVAGRIPGP